MVKKTFQPQTRTLAGTMRKCSIRGCPYAVFGTDKNTGKGYCGSHQYIRTDLKKKPLSRDNRTRNKKLARNKYGFDPFQWGFEYETDLFHNIWEQSDRLSVVSGRDLNDFEDSEQWFSCFAHILNKGHFPLYRFNPGNIMLVHPFEHYLIDHGTVAERLDYREYYPEADFNVFCVQREILKGEYKKITG